MARGGWVAAAAVMVLGVAASGAVGQVTRVATFENYVEGQNFQPTLMDPYSGIFFHDATGGTNSFTIEYSSTEFGGGNYITNGVVSPGATGAWTSNFGFDADLPAPANRVSFDVTYVVGRLSGVALTAYNSNNEVVAQIQGPESAPHNFIFQVTSSQYDITHFTVTASAFATGYDNISYTVLPEPVGIWWVLPAVVVGRRRRGAGCWG